MERLDKKYQAVLRPLLRVAAATGLAWALTACTTPVVRQPDVPPLGGQPARDVPRVDLLSLSPDMERFVEVQLATRDKNAGKAWALAFAALDPYVLDFEYDPMVTLTAEEAFRERRGNCLTFSSMFIAMARAAGLEAWYQEVRIPPEWSTVNETLLVSKHVNAVVREGPDRYVLDVSRRKTKPNERSHRLSDSEAEAQFYNNLGADALVRNDLVTAHAYFRAALRAQPGAAHVWSNLGVVYRRNAQTPDAVLAYQTALRFDPEQDVALNNLFTLYSEVGNLDAAAAIEKRVEQNRRDNPYYLLHLAEMANAEQRWSDAIGLLNRAIRIDATEYRFHYALAQSQYFSGHTDVARASLERARALAPADLSGGPLTLPGEG